MGERRSGGIGDRRRKTLQRGIYGRYLPSGHLVYLSNGTLFAVPFDLDRLEVRGTPVPVLSKVAHNSVYGSAEFDFSSNGTLVYRSGGGSGLSTVKWLDSAGKTQPLLSRPGADVGLLLSPDSERIVAVMPAKGPEGQKAQNHVNLLAELLHELRRRVPANR